MRLKKSNIYNLILNITLLLILFICLYEEFYNVKLLVIFTTIIVIRNALNLYKNKNGLLLVYLLYLYLSCLSIPLVEVFIENPLSKMSLNTSWYDMAASNKSVVIALIFIAFYCFFSNLFTLRMTEQRIYIDKDEVYENQKYHLFGKILTLSFFIYLSYQFLSGNLPLFSTYQEYFSTLTNIPFYSTFLFVYAVGVVALVATSQKHNYKISLVFIFLPGILLLLTGNRGELLYPLMAGIGVLVARGMKLNFKILLPLLGIFFLVIPLIGEVRNMEDFNDIKDIDLSPIDPFLTIGYTLRPLIYTVDWVEKGEKLVYGESFIVPVQRGIANNVPGITPIPYEGKQYNYRERLPTMGYSIIAESYHNFGKFSALIVTPFIILILLWGEKNISPFRIVFSGSIAAILINNVRNAFSFVPGQIVMLIILLVIYHLIWKIVTKNRKINLVTS